MQGRKTRTSRPLMFLALLLCVIIGGIFTKSSANPSPLDSGNMSEMFVADKPKESLKTDDSATADSDQPTDNSRKKALAPPRHPLRFHQQNLSLRKSRGLSRSIKRDMDSQRKRLAVYGRRFRV